ncbi:carbohydrate-binding module family 14 protein [Streptomyces sp. CFMR 7]|uniref:carbohydrate-binding module family 14 protein n=1 Tax=Streptomyces sp. CFMR 7 TaxID=1649184 RepID=UPI001642413B|nr:carbohydrate-binding module family 14 protein [Streptomyces sp. CFMR 7]
MKRMFALGVVLAAVLCPSTAFADAPQPTPGHETVPACLASADPNSEFVIIGDGDDPAVYYVCSNGVAHRFVCPQGTLFSVADKVCDWEWNVRRDGSSSPDASQG